MAKQVVGTLSWQRGFNDRESGVWLRSPSVPYLNTCWYLPPQGKLIGSQ